MIKILLAGVTAGQGYGFNRAFFFSYNNVDNYLEGYEAIGPSDINDAYSSWARLANISFPVILENASKQKGHLPIFEKINSYKLFIDKSEILSDISNNKKVFIYRENECNDNILKELAERIESNFFAIIPIFTKYNYMGILIIDNKFSSHSITENDIRLLEIFAFATAQTIEIKNLYNELQDKLEKIKEINNIIREQQEKMLQLSRMATIGETASIIAHEIKNPLVIIGGFTRMIKDKLFDNNAEYHGYASLVYNEVLRLQGLISNILHFSKQMNLNIEYADINDLINEISFFYKLEFEKKNITLVIDIKKDIPKFRFDYYKIKQVMINLLNNSIDATKENGVIKILVDYEPDAFVIITIKDNGYGIPLETQKNIFDFFYSNKANGSGIGLPLVRRIVEAHKGHLKFESKENEGTTFEIHLPVNL